MRVTDHGADVRAQPAPSWSAPGHANGAACSASLRPDPDLPCSPSSPAAGSAWRGDVKEARLPGRPAPRAPECVKQRDLVEAQKKQKK